MLNEYMEALKRGLEERDIKDREEVFSYFEEMISDHLENGKSEQEIIDALGDPQILLDAIGERKVKTEKMSPDEERGCVVFSGIRNVDIDVESYDIEIFSCKEETGRVEYDFTEDVSLDVEIDGDELKIDQRNEKIFIDSLFARIFHSGRSVNASAKIYIPQGKLEDLDIKTVSGDLELCDLQADELNIGTVSGDITLKDISMNEGKITAVSGDIELDDVDCLKTLKIETVSGDADAKGLSFKEMKAETVSGDLTLLLKGSREDYDIRKEGLKGPRTYERNGYRTLRYETVSGDLDYRFERD